MRNKLFWGYWSAGLTSLINLLWVTFQDISCYFWLVTPLFPPIILVCFVIFKSTTKQRDAIKACNDAMLFFISVITTAILTIKTIDLPHNDLFKVLMTNRIGYLLICSYTFLFAIKASVALSEAFEKVKEMIKKPTIPPQDKQ